MTPKSEKKVDENIWKLVAHLQRKFRTSMEATIINLYDQSSKTLVLVYDTDIVGHHTVIHYVHSVSRKYFNFTDTTIPSIYILKFKELSDRCENIKKKTRMAYAGTSSKK